MEKATHDVSCECTKCYLYRTFGLASTSKNVNVGKYESAEKELVADLKTEEKDELMSNKNLVVSCDKNGPLPENVKETVKTKNRTEILEMNWNSNNPMPNADTTSLAVSNSKKSWLLRLFESDVFDASIAMQYLYTAKEPGVLSYLGLLIGPFTIYIGFV